jgi:hypothetical protein
MVMPYKFDAKLVERGQEVDVEVGDPIFDEKVLVEAAPAEVARAARDAPTRATRRTAAPPRVLPAGAPAPATRRSSSTSAPRATTNLPTKILLLVIAAIVVWIRLDSCHGAPASSAVSPAPWPRGWAENTERREFA